MVLFLEGLVVVDALLVLGLEDIVFELLGELSQLSLDTLVLFGHLGHVGVLDRDRLVEGGLLLLTRVLEDEDIFCLSRLLYLVNIFDEVLQLFLFLNLN